VEWIATDTIKSEVLKLLDRDECDLQTLALIERLPIKGAGPKLSAAIERTDSADRAVRCFKALIATDEAFPLEELKIAYENTVITIAGHVGEDEKSTRTEQEAFRFQALEALGLCRSDNTYKLLVHLMDDDSSETRFLACWHLSGRPHEDTEKSIRVLLKDSNEHIRDGALLSLVRMGVQEHFRRAEGILLRHSLHTYRVLAALALGEGAKERALEPLLKAAGDRNADVRIQVCSSLVQIGSAKALPKLEQLTSDPEASVRRHAKTCLADLKTKLQEKEKTGG
jgi:HEAT repeat protein